MYLEEITPSPREFRDSSGNICQFFKKKKIQMFSKLLSCGVETLVDNRDTSCDNYLIFCLVDIDGGIFDCVQSQTTIFVVTQT